MDNQFPKTTISPTSSSTEPTPHSNEEQPPEHEEQLPIHNDFSNKSGKKKFFKLLLVLIVIAGSCYGVYYWQNTKVKSLSKDLASTKTQLASANAQITQLNKDQVKFASDVNETAKAFKDDLIPGQADTNRADGKILITAVYKPANATGALWIDYGTSPDKLDKSTAHATKGLNLGTDTYSFGQSLEIPKASVKAGTSYFYRVVASTKDGKTIQGAVASFTVAK